MTQTCILKNLKKGEAKDLPDIVLQGTGKKIIGRSPETLIESPSVSREHIVVKPKFEERIVLVRFIGKSPAALNGFVMKQEEAYEAQEGDIISLLFNSDYQYKVTFEGLPSVKRESTDEEMPETKHKRVKTEQNRWDSLDNGNCLIFSSKDLEGRSKIASYDMDNTLIKTVSGNVFAKNIDDWQLNYSMIPTKLRSLHENGFKIVIFTNQAGIETGSTTANDIKRKITMIQTRLDVPCQVFIATGKTLFRKPRIAMFEALEEQFNDEVKIDRNQSFYVGDAAGRPAVKITKKKADHSMADRLFAMNLGLSFYTPEEHFLNAKDTPKNWNRPQFDPKTVNTSISLLEPSTAKLTMDEQEVILLVGFPASGKSFFSHEYLKKKNYEIINRDTLHTAQKCLSAMETALLSKKSCVVDNTNPDPASRKKFIEVALKHKVPVRCFLFNTTYDQAKHNNIFRELCANNSHQKIGDMVFHIYKKNYVEPNKKEGFAEIVRVNFVPKFKNEGEEKLYKMYLVEK